LKITETHCKVTRYTVINTHTHTNPYATHTPYFFLSSLFSEGGGGKFAAQAKSGLTGKQLFESGAAAGHAEDKCEEEVEDVDYLVFRKKIGEGVGGGGEKGVDEEVDDDDDDDEDYVDDDEEEEDDDDDSYNSSDGR